MSFGFRVLDCWGLRVQGWESVGVEGFGVWRLVSWVWEFTVPELYFT